MREEQFDKIASIEMAEHVGCANFVSPYLTSIRKMMARKDSKFLLQVCANGVDLGFYVQTCEVWDQITLLCVVYLHIETAVRGSRAVNEVFHLCRVRIWGGDS